MKYGLNPAGTTMREMMGISDARTTEIAEVTKRLYHETKNVGVIPMLEGLLDNFQGVELIWASMGLMSLINQEMNPVEQFVRQLEKMAGTEQTKETPNY